MTNQEILHSIHKTWQMESESIAALKNTVSSENIVAAVKLIAECKGRILVSGCGTSGAAAKKIAHSLCCVEQPAMFLSPADAVHGQLGMLQSEDILIAISKGGNTSEILNLIPACKAKGAKLIGITENMQSTLAKQSDLVLNVRASKEPCPFNMLATASTLSVIATFDAICIALMLYTDYTREQFAIIHPGGAVGDRLLMEENE